MKNCQDCVNRFPVIYAPLADASLRERETGTARHQLAPSLRLQAVIFLSVCLCGCATSRQLYEGQARPKAEVVTVEHQWNMFGMKILIGEKWVNLNSGSTVMPGTYKVSVLCNAIITGSSGAAGTLERAGLPHRGFAEVPDSFTADAGDTVTYFWSGGERTGVNDGGQTYHCPGFDHTVTRTKLR